MAVVLHQGEGDRDILLIRCHKNHLPTGSPLPDPFGITVARGPCVYLILRVGKPARDRNRGQREFAKSFRVTFLVTADCIWGG